jgi:hypothetical protein
VCVCVLGPQLSGQASAGFVGSIGDVQLCGGVWVSFVRHVQTCLDVGRWPMQLLQYAHCLSCCSTSTMVPCLYCLAHCSTGTHGCVRVCTACRYPGNVNLSFAYVEGESLIMGLKVGGLLLLWVLGGGVLACFD